MAILYRGTVFQQHETGLHPECPARLQAIKRRLDGSDLLTRFAPGAVRAATRKELELIHEAEYVEAMADFASAGGGRLAADTVASAATFDVASKAAGAAIDAVGQVVTGEHKRAACLIRPPGHHALPDRAMGFCLFNNVAIAARQAVEEHGLRRVLIVDWDVHHGNGTQDVFFSDENIYFFSSHRWPFYPGTGAADEKGSGPGLGTIFNLPLTFGISSEEFMERFGAALQQAAERCRPELVLISAGFDAHRDDPIGSLGLESSDFVTLTNMVVDVAREHADGRVVSLLEGGYDVEALAESVELHLRTLVEDTDA